MKKGLMIFHLHFFLVNMPQMNIFQNEYEWFKWVFLKCHCVLVMQGSLRSMRGRLAHFIQDIDSHNRLFMSEFLGETLLVMIISVTKILIGSFYSIYISKLFRKRKGVSACILGSGKEYRVNKMIKIPKSIDEMEIIFYWSLTISYIETGRRGWVTECASYTCWKKIRRDILARETPLRNKGSQPHTRPPAKGFIGSFFFESMSQHRPFI